MVCSQESLTEAVKKNIDKVYDELSTITEPLSYKKRTAWFVRNDEERQGIYNYLSPKHRLSENNVKDTGA